MNGCTWILGLVAMLSVATAAEKPPNVVVILSDDQGWTDYGFMGHEVIETPHLDRLASRSLVFERGYVASPLCRPSLATMVTGRFPFIHGVTGNDVDGMKQRAKLDEPVQQRFHQWPSFIRSLTAKGYLAHQSGKWWEGSYRDGGFTHGMTHGDPKRGGRHGDEGLKIGREGLEPIGRFLDLAKDQGKPFLLWYAPFLPHAPHHPPERLLRKYSQPGVAMDVARYQAMCEWFDETCGALIQMLDDKQLSQNTMVVYICDNGWAASSGNADDPDQKQWPRYALRSKGSPFEMGVRTPILVSWPGRVKPGRPADLAHAIDLFPTIAAATGIEVPAGLQGVNLLDATARAKRQAVFGVAHSIHNMSPGAPDATLQYLWCVDGKWKLLLRCDGVDTTDYRKVHSWDDVAVRLYDVLADPHETRNLAGEHPEVVESLSGKIRNWRESLGASRP